MHQTGICALALLTISEPKPPLAFENTLVPSGLNISDSLLILL